MPPRFRRTVRPDLLSSGAESEVREEINHYIDLRTKELGATRRDVLGLIVSQGMAMTIVGLVIGLVAAVAVTRLFGSLLFGVEPFDVRAYGEVALLLGTVALLATALPARKASRIDPMTPLRGE
jgi:ABC-type antimicrobial peptide transport system permease subunit